MHCPTHSGRLGVLRTSSLFQGVLFFPIFGRRRSFSAVVNNQEWQRNRVARFTREYEKKTSTITVFSNRLQDVQCWRYRQPHFYR